MRLIDLFENENSRLVVIYPGRFHPFHIGHGKVYKYLKQNYKGAQVFIASSGKTDGHKSPFAFDEKKKMMMLAGVDPNAIVQTTVPYVATEITDRFDPDTTIVVYAVSEKDMAEDPRFDFPQNGLKMKKSGDPSHVQKWPGIANAKPLREHSYIVTVPTFTFSINGESINSATQIRNMIAKADENELKSILSQLYQTKNIPQEIIEIFKRKLQPDTMSENWDEATVYESLLEAEYYREIAIEKKLTGGEKRSRESNFKKLKKHKSDFKDRYGDESESVMWGVATNRAKSNKIKTQTENQMKITDIMTEETYDGDDFYEAYGDLWYNDDEQLDEAEYQGRKVKLGKPMRGDVKKFKVYVRNPKGNIVKVNFGDPDMRIKKSNPARRKSFRARHNCDNPGPRHKARYWSCRKW